MTAATSLPGHAQVGIVGGGPAGLLLSQLLHAAGITSVVLEARSRAGLERLIRAGVLEQGTTDLLTEAGVGERLRREGAVHHGIELRYDGESHRIPLSMLTGGKGITLYAQHEVVKDLIAARIAAGGHLAFEATVTGLQPGGDGPAGITYTHAGKAATLSCDFIAGCDGFHGVARQAIPPAVRREFLHEYPYGWFGILVDAPPSSPELIYARHARGFALVSTRSATLQRMYFQCSPTEDAQGWRDGDIWRELEQRLATRSGWRPVEGPIVQRDVVSLRSFVCEPMQYGRLFLAGDAAHIVPPTGAKGLNLAAADVRTLAQALVAHYHEGRSDLLDSYSGRCLQRAWRAQRFSSWLTTLLHTDPTQPDFEARLQLADLQHLTSSKAAATALAENYVDLARH
jgi:p-hydroxybenzoate 3-monooxygenase